MQTFSEIALQRATRGVFTRNQAEFWAGCSGPRLDGLLKRAVASHEVWRIRKGLYCLSDQLRHKPVDPLVVAQRIHGPSYISLETALALHDWIPEGVHATTSVTLDRSRTFDTPLGLFSFTRIPQRLLLAGVRRVSADREDSYFLASPLKALADLVYVQRRDWTSAEPVEESLRIDREDLETLNRKAFDEVTSAYKPGRVRRFLAGLRKDLGL